MAHEGHDHHHHDHDHGASEIAVAVALIHVARGPDTTGLLMPTLARLLEAAGHSVVQRVSCDGRASTILQAVDAAQQQGARAIVLLGGTGLSAPEGAIEAVVPTFIKTLPGFGEWVRQQLFKPLGTHAFSLRAEAGLIRGQTLVFIVPAELQQATQIVNALIAPHLGELIRSALG